MAKDFVTDANLKTNLKNFYMPKINSEDLAPVRKLCCVLEPFDTCDQCGQDFCDDCSIIASDGFADKDISGCREFLCYRCFHKLYGKFKP